MDRLLPALMLAGACSGPPTATPPNVVEQVCEDDRVSRTFGGDPHHCHDYLTSCLDDLTDAQRAQWHKAVASCLHDKTELFRCFAQLPWC